MNANESRQKAEERRLELGRQQWKRIIDAINKAINIPTEETVFYEDITSENLNTLRENGYTVTKEGGRLGLSNYRITWRHVQTEDKEKKGTTYYPGGISINHQSL